MQKALALLTSSASLAMKNPTVLATIFTPRGLIIILVSLAGKIEENYLNNVCGKLLVKELVEQGLVIDCISRFASFLSAWKFLYNSRVGWCISEVCAYQVILKNLCLEIAVQRVFSQKSIFTRDNTFEKWPKKWEIVILS